MTGIEAAERGVLPDSVVRLGIRRLLRTRLGSLTGPTRATEIERKKAFLRAMSRSPLAPLPEKANEQHYEVPPAFFRSVLGPQLKYSSCLFEPATVTLGEAERAMLALSAERADLADGMEILELGCGWGSLTLWMAERYPQSRILAVSNSAPQREYILGECEARNFSRVEVRTADMNDFAPAERSFDRVVSVEMIEHMRNWEELFRRIASWLRPDGRLFLHHFAHREHAYPFETTADDDWMGRHFFTGGLMPSEDLALHFPHDLEVEDFWRVSGNHYRDTAEAWLGNLDAARATVLPVLASVHGDAEAELGFARWRLFFLACAELFGFKNGEEWGVMHLLLAPRVAR